MYAVAGYAEAQSVFSVRIIRPGRDAGSHRFAFAPHLFLDRWGHIPSGVFFFRCNPKFASWSRPVGPPKSHREVTHQPALFEIEKHPLRDIDDDPIAGNVRYD